MNYYRKKDFRSDVKDVGPRVKSNHTLHHLKPLFTCCFKIDQRKLTESPFDRNTNENDYIVEKLVVKRISLASFVILSSRTQEKSKIVSNTSNSFVQSPVNVKNEHSLIPKSDSKQKTDSLESLQSVKFSLDFQNCIKKSLHKTSNPMWADVLYSNRCIVESLDVQAKKEKVKNDEKIVEDALLVKSENSENINVLLF